MFILLQHSYDIMLECWHETPGKRPSFTQLRAKFDSLLGAQQGNAYIDLQTDECKDYYNIDLLEQESGVELTKEEEEGQFKEKNGDIKDNVEEKVEEEKEQKEEEEEEEEATESTSLHTPERTCKSPDTSRRRKSPSPSFLRSPRSPYLKPTPSPSRLKKSPSPTRSMASVQSQDTGYLQVLFSKHLLLILLHNTFCVLT